MRATTEGAHYALSCLETVDVGAGDHALVYGATGAIGSAAVQPLEHHGVSVTAVCDGRGIDLAASLKADTVIDYTAEDFTRTDERFDVVLDAVAKRAGSGGPDRHARQHHRRVSLRRIGTEAGQRGRHRRLSRPPDPANSDAPGRDGHLWGGIAWTVRRAIRPGVSSAATNTRSAALSLTNSVGRPVS